MRMTSSVWAICWVFPFRLSFWWSWRLLPTSFMPIPNSENTSTLLAATNKRHGFRASMHPSIRCLFTSTQVSLQDWLDWWFRHGLVRGNRGLASATNLMPSRPPSSVAPPFRLVESEQLQERLLGQSLSTSSSSAVGGNTFIFSLLTGRLEALGVATPKNELKLHHFKIWPM